MAMASIEAVGDACGAVGLTLLIRWLQSFGGLCLIRPSYPVVLEWYSVHLVALIKNVLPLSTLRQSTVRLDQTQMPSDAPPCDHLSIQYRKFGD